VRKVLLTEKIHPTAVEFLQERAEIVVAPDPSEATVKMHIGDVHGVILRTATRMTRELIESAPGLMVISRTGAGFDNVDLDAATARGVMVCNQPGINTIAVAEHAVALILALAKALPFYDAEMRAGNWQCRNSNKTFEVRGKTLGVLGFGKIGGRVAAIMSDAFGMNVLAYDPYVTEAAGGGQIALAPLGEVLGRADIVSVHLPANAETKGLLSRELLRRLKKGALLVNTSRGSVCDEAALVELLRDGSIAGAGLDVFATEPLPADHPFMTMKNVILTPHCAALTSDCVRAIALGAAQAVIDVFEGRVPAAVVNREGLDRRAGALGTDTGHLS